MGSVYTKSEAVLFKKLDSPKKIQDFLNTLGHNPAKDDIECRSPRQVLKAKKAHCMEGALLAAAILEFHGHKPYVLDLRSTDADLDHVVAPFQQFGCWGALSKTNHVVLRYREPIYKTLRELVMSYFHEYFLHSGIKTLREYSQPFNVVWFDKLGRLSDAGTTVSQLINWRTSDEDMYKIPKHLDKIKHYHILSSAQQKNLRKADAIEIKAGKLIDKK